MILLMPGLREILSALSALSCGRRQRPGLYDAPRLPMVGVLVGALGRVATTSQRSTEPSFTSFSPVIM